MSAMVRLRGLLDSGHEVTFLPGDGAGEDGRRTYEVHMITPGGHGMTSRGASPQEALLWAQRMQGDGRYVTYTQAPDGGWFADMRGCDGRPVGSGHGRTQAEALAELRERMQGDGQAAADDEPEPSCGRCAAPIGIFPGHGDGWRHYRGAGTVASPVELVDLDHEAAL